MLATFLLLSGCGEADPNGTSPGSTAATTDSGAADGIVTTYQLDFPSGAMEIVEIEIGKRVGRNMRIAEPTDVFEPEDPVYVVVITEGGEPGARMGARWLAADGEVFGRETRSVSSGKQYIEFSPPRREALPLGAYAVEFTLAGERAGSIEFRIAEEVEEEAQGFFQTLARARERLRAPSGGGMSMEGGAVADAEEPAEAPTDPDEPAEAPDATEAPEPAEAPEATEASEPADADEATEADEPADADEPTDADRRTPDTPDRSAPGG